jgi:hypothetical protein
MWRELGLAENNNVMIRHDLHVFGPNCEYVVFEREIHGGGV